MKKLALLFSISFALTISNNLSAQILEQGGILLETYYGGPSLFNIEMKKNYGLRDPEKNAKTSNLGPLGIRGELMFRDNFGIGLDLGYSLFETAFVDKVVIKTMNGDTLIKNYPTTITSSRTTIMVTWNYHVIVTEKFDLNANFGFGIGRRSTEVFTENNNFKKVTGFGFYPFSVKIGIGMHYFFTPELGINFNLTLGRGGIFNGGISFKLPTIIE